MIWNALDRRMMRRLLIVAAAWAAFCGIARAEDADATITITPVPTVSLSLPTSYYHFGPIDVNTSTNSATALTLSNSGQVSVKVDKRISVQSDPAGWTAGTSSGMNTYVLYAATSTTRPAIGDFTAASRFGAEGNISPLTGITGSEPVLTPTGAEQSVDLWFRLDMPTAVSNTAGRTVTIQFTATAQ